MNRPRYSMSFTTAALLYRESLLLANLYAQTEDWAAVRARVVAANLLQMRTANASQRICREGISRLKQLTAAELLLLNDAAPGDQRYLLWLAVCKRYRFIYDFAVEIVQEKYLRLDLQLALSDYDLFFERKAEWHPEVAGVAPATRSKQRQIVFKTMREAELVDASLRIVPALPAPHLAAAIAADDPQHFALFPTSQRELQQWIQPTTTPAA